MEQSKSLNSENISKNRLQMDKGYTPDWTNKDRELYRKAKADIQSGKSVLKRIE